MITIKLTDLDHKQIGPVLEWLIEQLKEEREIAKIDKDFTKANEIGEDILILRKIVGSR